VAAKALGFGGLVHNVGAVQNGRGKLEAAVLFWCAQIGHDFSRLASDVVLWSGEEFGLLRLPEAFATGSSIMPQKRNPDLFELTRARAAAVEGDLAQTMAIKAKLTSGYHRDFQLLKEPLLRGVRRTLDMARMMGVAVPALEVDSRRAAAALRGGLLATDEVMRRVERGVPFRSAYREVAASLKRGEEVPAIPAREMLARRTATGGIGRLELENVQREASVQARWRERELARFTKAVARLRGRF
jgi:argininosuccinate lyase